MAHDFETQEQAHSFDPRRDGFIHTAEVQVRWRQGIDIEQPRGNKQSITEWHGGANRDGSTATFRLNPNNERVCSPYSGNMVKRGNCRSLADFEAILTVTANRAGFESGDLDITRADFAVDHYGDEGADRFQKLCDLLITAFIVKNDIPPKYQHWSETTITREPKSNKATAGQITMERYNKAIQQPEHGALWRFELRYSKDKKHPDKEQPRDVRGMLEAIAEELRELPKFYAAAQKQLNEALLAEYDRLQIESKNNLRINQFLYQNSDRLFSNAQVKHFFKGLGADAKKAAKSANNYTSRHKHIYISAADFTSFTELLEKMIEKYLTSEAFFEDFSPKTNP